MAVIVALASVAFGVWSLGWTILDPIPSLCLFWNSSLSALRLPILLCVVAGPFVHLPWVLLRTKTEPLVEHVLSTRQAIGSLVDVLSAEHHVGHGS
jgi:hypothetical protein